MVVVQQMYGCCTAGVWLLCNRCMVVVQQVYGYCTGGVWLYSRFMVVVQ